MKSLHGFLGLSVFSLMLAGPAHADLYTPPPATDSDGQMIVAESGHYSGDRGISGQERAADQMKSEADGAGYRQGFRQVSTKSPGSSSAVRGVNAAVRKP
jgi:hypothetical protein